MGILKNNTKVVQKLVKFSLNGLEGDILCFQLGCIERLKRLKVKGSDRISLQIMAKLVIQSFGGRKL